MRLVELLAETAAALRSSEAQREAEILLGHALDRSRAWLYAHPDDLVPATAVARCRALVARRRAGVPVAYLIGRREFWSLELEVTPAVLIPRAETELLVELALQRISRVEAVRVADLGTGSGAIALAIARERPRARVLATDCSAEALAVARANAARLGLDNVAFARGSWCAALRGERFDLILANPPYLRSADPHLAEGDLRFEPQAALVAGADGLQAIRRIAHGAPTHLAAGGWLLLEHGFDQGEAVRALLRQSGLCEVFTERDLEHRERVSGGRALG
jgi:release factor glutamine methyltransferase